MADEINRPSTHFSSLEAKIRNLTSAPAEPLEGDAYYDTSLNKMCIYTDNGGWKCKNFSTTTSTSTSTTSTSTSTSTTSTSSSTSTTSTSSSTTTTTSTSTSTSTSTTTTA